MLQLAHEAGPVGIRVSSRGGMGRRVQRQKRAHHAAERLIDVGAMAWRPRGQGPAHIREARITEAGAEIQEAREHGAGTGFVEALAKTKPGVEWAAKLLDVWTRMNALLGPAAGG